MSSSSPSAWRAWLWRFTFALVTVSLLTAGGVAGGSWYLNHTLTRATEVDLDLDGRVPGAINFLILGSDSRAFVQDETDAESFGSTSQVGGQRADTIIVAHVEPRNRKGLLVSFPRDLYVRHPGRSGLHRINEAFEEGPQGVIDVIKANFDIPIHHYLELDFAAFRSIVDAIGGVRMYIPSPVRDRQTGLDVPEPGCVLLDGRQSLAWVRSRHFSYMEAGRWRTDPTGDIGRITRQQEFIRRLMAQAIRQGALNPLRANRLANAVMPNLKVDEGLEVRDALRLVQAFRGIGPGAVEMISLPTRSAGAGLRTTAETEEVVARLRVTDGGDGADVAPSDVRVRVLNGTGAAGLAGDTSAALARVGFVPAGAADAERFDYRVTEVRHTPQAQGKAAFLARWLQGGAGRLVADSGLGNADVVLVVGRDFEGITDRPGPARVPSTSTTGTPPPPPDAGDEDGDVPAPSGGPEQPDC